MVIKKSHNELCKECKENVYKLLASIFDNVIVNYDINLPARLEDKAVLEYEKEI